MLFNSPEFVFIFLPIVYFGYFICNKFHLVFAAKVWLVSSSLFFYAYWDADYLFLLILSIVVNYKVGLILQKYMYDKSVTSLARKKIILFFGLLFNLSLLIYYKYSNFIITNMNDLYNSDYPMHNLVLPLAISFFTFQQIAYLVDCNSDNAKEHSFINYCLFVSFFPQLIAGPIVHHKEMMSQFSDLRNKVFNRRNVIFGMFIFIVGLSKKVIVADTFSIWANAGFESEKILSFYESWITSLSYTLQLYYDFSGYADMAVGTALIFNIRLPINFNSPYKAMNIQDFWRRWHITLSRWLRDYIYIPLGGNRKSEIRINSNLLLTFLIGGLWHGASWTFVVWGALHGLALIIFRFWSKYGVALPKFIAWFITFIFINTTWVFFRANTFSDALNILKSMFDVGVFLSDEVLFVFWSMKIDSALTYYLQGFNDFNSFYTVIFVLVFFIVAISLPNSSELMREFKVRNDVSRLYAYGITFIIAVMFSICMTILLASSGSEFLYFNF